MLTNIWHRSDEALQSTTPPSKSTFLEKSTRMPTLVLQTSSVGDQMIKTLPQNQGTNCKINQRKENVTKVNARHHTHACTSNHHATSTDPHMQHKDPPTTPNSPFTPYPSNNACNPTNRMTSYKPTNYIRRAEKWERMLLMRAGDVESNPGPPEMEDKSILEC